MRLFFYVSVLAAAGPLFGQNPVTPGTAFPATTSPTVTVNTQATGTAPGPKAANPAAKTLPPAEDISGILGMNNLPDSLAPAMPPIEGKGVNDSMLPLRIPGYELRVLDVRKKLLYNIKGNWVEASLPVYFYFPTQPGNTARALQMLQQAFDQITKLGEKGQWSASEFREVLVNLDASIALLEAGMKDAKDNGQAATSAR